MPEFVLNMQDDKPVLAYDRRLPKNARSKQHLLSRIHSIESTLQRLYGKLDADAELPDVEDIEKIMAATIKQTTYEPDQNEDSHELKNPALLPPPSMTAQNEPFGSDEEDEMNPEKEMGEECGNVSDLARREQVRQERRKRMADREATRGGSKGSGVKGGVTFADTAETNCDAHSAFEDDNIAESRNPLLRTAPAGMLPTLGPSLDTLSPKKKELSKTMDADPQTLSRLKKFQEDDSNELEDGYASMGGRAAPQQATGGKSRTKLDPTSTYSDDEEGSMDKASQQHELQRKAAEMGEDWSAIFSHVRHGKKNEVSNGLERGCPADLKDKAGNTLLNVCAQNNRKSIIKTLLRRGASINTQNHKGNTPLHFCFTYGYSDLGNYLISKGADDTIENLACMSCYQGLGE